MLRKSFSFVFSIAAFVAAALAIAFFTLPFLSSVGESSALGASYAYTVSGFALAFGGSGLLVTKIGDNVTKTTTGEIDMNPGIMAAFILVVIAVLLLAIFVVFVWTRRGNSGLKVLPLGAFILLGVAAGLAFSVLPLTGTEASESEGIIGTLTQGIGYGAIMTGIFGAGGAVLSLLAGTIAPESSAAA